MSRPVLFIGGNYAASEMSNEDKETPQNIIMDESNKASGGQ